MNKIPTVYDPSYYALTPTQSMRKLPEIYRSVMDKGLIEHHPIAPHHSEKDIIDKLKAIHNPQYVDDFDRGEGNCESQSFPWTSAIRNGVFAMQRGMLTAAALAFHYKIAANIAQGFHHARPDHGAGFCTFNGLALVAKEYPDKKILVWDCDAHQGDGTGCFVDSGVVPNLYNLSLYGEDAGYRSTHPHNIYKNVGADAQKYRNEMVRCIQHIVEIQPDLVIYQAGMDVHTGDPFSHMKLDDADVCFRDRIVFDSLRTMGIPCLFVMAGGYQKMEPLVQLHTSTFQEAVGSYSMME